MQTKTGSLLNLSKLFDSKTIHRGHRYYDDGRVLHCNTQDLDDHYITIHAQVDGSRSEVYDVFIKTQIKNQAVLDFEGSCSCPVGYFCKHMVAALYEAQPSHEEIEHKPSKQDSSSVSQWFDALQTDDRILQHNLTQQEEEIFYVLDVSSNKDALIMELKHAKRLKSGNLGKEYFLYPESIVWTRNATEEDAKILLACKRATYESSSGSIYTIPFKTDQLGAVFEDLVKTGRAYWKENREEPLRMAEMRTASFSWKILDNGSQKLEGSVEGGAFLLPINPPYYVSDDAECGLVQGGQIDSRLLPLLAHTPPLPPQDVSHFCEQLKKEKLNLPLPKSLTVEKIKIKPKLHLELVGVRNDSFDAKGLYPLLVPYLLYGTTKIPYGIEKTTTSSLEGNKFKVIERAQPEESELIHNFYNRYLVYFTDRNYTPYSVYKEYPEAFEFGDIHGSYSNRVSYLSQVLPEWKKRYSVHIDPTFPFEFIESTDDDWYFETDSEAQMDWFDLELGIEVDGKKINLLPTLTELIKTQPKYFSAKALEEMDEGAILTVIMKEGKVLKLPMDKIKGILQTLAEINDPDSLTNQKLKISRLRAGELLGMSESLNLKWKEGEILKEFARKLKNFKGISEASPPKQLQTTLRPYQREGLNWLQFLSHHSLGGILADDMGLGKTVQTLAHLCLEHEKLSEKKPSLIIAPTSLMVNWNQEVEKFAPHLKTLTLHGADRKDLFKKISKCDLIFTTYPLLSRDQEELLKHAYHAIVFDEAQMVKNPTSKAAKVCRELKSHHRICLSGTPMENHLDELWSLSEITNPGRLGTPKQFKKLFRTPIEKYGALGPQKTLAKRIAPFMLRRTKETVALDLPEKTEIIKIIELEGEQKKLYEGIRLSMHKKVNEALRNKGLNSSQILILDALLKLRQACCDPRLVKLENAKHIKESAKFTYLIEMLKKLIEEGRKILLFSCFTSMLALIEEELHQMKISYSKITGETKDRKTPVLDFQEGKNPLFLISLKAGGTGLNLTAADTVIHYDPWWNPAAEAQATDRAHRIGQDKPVFVYKLITQKTVEEKILKMQEKKRALMDGILDQKEQKHSSLTLEDIEYLFEPLS